MSKTQDSVFDLEQHFLPAWAKKAPDENRYADYEGERERPGDRKREWRDRPPRRREPTGDRRPAEGRRPSAGEPQFPRRDRPPRDRDDRRFGERPPRRDQPPPPPAPLPEIGVALVPDDKGVESLARQIRMTGRAYPLFEIAQMILAKPERHNVTFSIRKNAEGAVIQPLFLCALDDTLWLSEDDAVRYLLERHFTTFYQPERTQIEPPKGVYTFVAQCGMSGVILGPPNHHDYQNQLRKLHAQRFSRMPFEVFKSRVKIVREESVVKKWIDDQSWKTQYVCLNMPEPLKLGTREEVEQHFRQTHLPNLIQTVESHRLSGTASRNLRDPGLRRLVRQAWDDQRRFPIQVATVLSQQFAATGLQFFKVNRTVTHVAVARPSYLDLETTPVSESVTRIVEHINAHPKCTHKQLLDALAPMPAGEETAEPPPERTAVIADLHWLVHQGHVIEFADGVLETAKKPLPRPPKPAPAPPAAETVATPEPPPNETATAGASPSEAALATADAGVVSDTSAETASALPAETGPESTPSTEPALGVAPPVEPPLASVAPGESSPEESQRADGNPGATGPQ
jgi:hypothetical protein